jgi:hypothetical protein
LEVISIKLSLDGTIVYASVEGTGVYRLGTPFGKQSSEEFTEGQVSNGEPGDPLPDGKEGGGRINLPCPGSLLPLLLAGVFWFQ